MPLFISKQAEKDYWTLRHLMDFAEFHHNLPLMDFCERHLELFRPVREIRWTHLLPHHRKLDFEDLIPKQPPLIKNAAWLLPNPSRTSTGNSTRTNASKRTRVSNPIIL